MHCDCLTAFSGGWFHGRKYIQRPWPKVFQVGSYCEVWIQLTCDEAEAFANLACSIGREEIAKIIIGLRSTSDDGGDDHYPGDADGER